MIAVITQILPLDFRLRQMESFETLVGTMSTSMYGAQPMHFLNPASGVDLDLVMVNVMKAKSRSHTRPMETKLARDLDSKHFVA
jgi:hypothetical protein